MTKEDMMTTIAKEAADIAKSQATAMLASVTADEIKPLVLEQIKAITDPLEAEIKTTGSIWVRIRNRLYVQAINSAVDAIVIAVQNGITDLQK